MSREHNWFSVQGDIRVNKNMTPAQLLDLMDQHGIELLGGVCVSRITDEMYESAEDYAEIIETLERQSKRSDDNENNG